MLIATAPRAMAVWMATEAVKRPTRRGAAMLRDRTSDVSNIRSASWMLDTVAASGETSGRVEETDPRSAARRARKGTESDWRPTSALPRRTAPRDRRHRERTGTLPRRNGAARSQRPAPHRGLAAGVPGEWSSHAQRRSGAVQRRAAFALLDHRDRTAADAAERRGSDRLLAPPHRRGVGGRSPSSPLPD